LPDPSINYEMCWFVQTGGPRWDVPLGRRDSLVYYKSSQRHVCAADVEKRNSDHGKRKLRTHEDSDVFETYSHLCARNVGPRFPSDLPQAGGVNISQPMYNEAVGSMSVHTE
nr:hypothetical protein [Tanacetum cinerariifolium]